MIQISSNSSPSKLVMPIPGVPMAQAKELDRRRRLRLQLQSFTTNIPARSEKLVSLVIAPDEPDPA